MVNTRGAQKKKNFVQTRFFISNAVLCLFVVFGCFSSCTKKDTYESVDAMGRTVVQRYGFLSVQGTQLCDQYGNPVQLRGMSSHGLQWHGKYANEDVLKWLRDDWNVQIWRAAMYLTEGGYIANANLKQKVIDSIEAAQALGIYVIVDWHVHLDRDPRRYQERAIDFFTEIAKTYGHLPNIIYEICNEPNGEDVTWNGVIKPYAEILIETIRQYDPNNIIIVGTPTWSQDVDIAAMSPIQNQKNIMYSLHFYAGSHGSELRQKMKTALKLGLPIFVTEWGTTLNTGGGDYYPQESLEWIRFMKKNKISWANWSVNNKGEASGILKFNADRDAKGGWTERDLSPSGIFIKNVLKNK